MIASLRFLFGQPQRLGLAALLAVLGSFLFPACGARAPLSGYGGEPTACQSSGQACAAPGDCCGGLSCGPGGVCAPASLCQPDGKACTLTTDC
jgi:hypothetical protein